MKFVRDIPLDQIRAGDHFEAIIETLNGAKRYARRCTCVSVHGSILRVKTGTRKDAFCIFRREISSEFAWGERR